MIKVKRKEAEEDEIDELMKVYNRILYLTNWRNGNIDDHNWFVSKCSSKGFLELPEAAAVRSFSEAGV